MGQDGLDHARVVRHAELGRDGEQKRVGLGDRLGAGVDPVPSYRKLGFTT